MSGLFALHVCSESTVTPRLLTHWYPAKMSLHSKINSKTGCSIARKGNKKNLQNQRLFNNWFSFDHHIYRANKTHHCVQSGLCPSLCCGHKSPDGRGESLKIKEATSPFDENSHAASSFTLKSKNTTGVKRAKSRLLFPPALLSRFARRFPRRRRWKEAGFHRLGWPANSRCVSDTVSSFLFLPLPPRLSPSFLYTPQLTIPLAAHSSAYQPLNKRLIKGSA